MSDNVTNWHQSRQLDDPLAALGGVVGAFGGGGSNNISPGPLMAAAAASANKDQGGATNALVPKQKVQQNCCL